MDYEKKYKDALARMELCVRIGLKITPEYIFPELAESEDERIRKWIASYIHHGVFTEDEHPMALKAVEWLEKQKEQKPAEQGVNGRRGRIGTTPELIRKKAEAFQALMEPPYDADDICSAYETGAMENIEKIRQEIGRLKKDILSKVHHYPLHRIELLNALLSFLDDIAGAIKEKNKEDQI